MPTDIQKKHQENLRDNREKLLVRKARTRRLIEHGAIAESFLPESEEMSPEMFKEKLQALFSPIGRRIQSGPERSDTTEICGKELRTSCEVTLLPALTSCLSREGYSPKDLARLLELVKSYPEKVPEGGSIRVLSKIDNSRMIIIKRMMNILKSRKWSQ